MPRDDRLRARLTQLADSSQGRLTFQATTSTLLAGRTGVQLSRSPNPLYIFEFNDLEGNRHSSVAFTLVLDGEKRPATRAEALGRSLAESDGKLFELNPFLLVFDYVGERLLAASAAALFHAFTVHASERDLPYSGSSSFSLSPNFRHGTIHMYAELREPLVWAVSMSSPEFSADKLIEFLSRVLAETESKHQEISRIVRAIKSRLDAAPSDSAHADNTYSPPADVAGQDWVQLEPRDRAVRVDNRIWRMILTAISSSSGVILVGPPGTGKSALVRKAVSTLSDTWQKSGLPGLKPPLWATPDESWTARDLIGGETVVGGEIVFRPGWVLQAIAEDRWLVLDEANRGDLDRIFGALLTWLAGGEVAVGVESSAEDAKVIELGWTSGRSKVETAEADSSSARGRIRYLAGKETWRLLGTYNALDAQRVFRIGTALGRRFARVPIPPISPQDFDQIMGDATDKLAARAREKIGLLYRAHYESEVTRVGPALFLDMRNYIAAATELRTGASKSESFSTADQDKATVIFPSQPEHALQGSPEVEGFSEAVATNISATKTHVGATDRDDGVSYSATDGEGTLSPAGAVDMAVSEAYVLSLGTYLAQLEDPDLDRLMQRVDMTEALSQEGIRWVTEMTRSLA